MRVTCYGSNRTWKTPKCGMCPSCRRARLHDIADRLSDLGQPDLAYNIATTAALLTHKSHRGGLKQLKSI